VLGTLAAFFRQGAQGRFRFPLHYGLALCVRFPRRIALAFASYSASFRFISSRFGVRSTPLRDKLLGKINVGRDAHIAPPTIKLSEYGIISKNYIENINSAYNDDDCPAQE